MARLSNNQGGYAATTTKRSSLLASNPVMRRLDKVNEYDETDSATYGGITGKTVFFLLFSIAGIILQRILSANLVTGNAFEINIKNFVVEMYTTEAIALVAAVILGVVFQLLAFFAKPTTPVTGALYCVTQGYFISFLIFKVLKGKEYLGLLALVITMTIILVMSILYTTGAIRVTKKFKMVMLTLLVRVDPHVHRLVHPFHPAAGRVDQTEPGLLDRRFGRLHHHRGAVLDLRLRDHRPCRQG